MTPPPGKEGHAGAGEAGAGELRRLRSGLGLSLDEMAGRMGMTPQAYAGLEERPLQPHHLRLAESIALDCAVERRDATLLPPGLRSKLLLLAGLLAGRAPTRAQGEDAASSTPRRVRAEDEERGQQTTDRRFNADD
jgi:transcriptional regulator with XRE-family HTH domain